MDVQSDQLVNFYILDEENHDKFDRDRRFAPLYAAEGISQYHRKLVLPGEGKLAFVVDATEDGTPTDVTVEVRVWRD